jgi:hypothetical protein
MKFGLDTNLQFPEWHPYWASFLAGCEVAHSTDLDALTARLLRRDLDVC